MWGKYKKCRLHTVAIKCTWEGRDSTPLQHTYLEPLNKCNKSIKASCLTDLPADLSIHVGDCTLKNEPVVKCLFTYCIGQSDCHQLSNTVRLVYPHTLVTRGFGRISEACGLDKHPHIVHAITIGTNVWCLTMFLLLYYFLLFYWSPVNGLNLDLEQITNNSSCFAKRITETLVILFSASDLCIWTCY